MSRHPFWHELPEIHDDLDRVRDRVIAEASSARGAVGDALCDYVARPGKMLRPGCVIIGSWAGSSRATDRIIEIAAAVETLHLATLIHDDVIDESPMRRGQPSLHSIYGRREAVLMGDYLLSRCFQMIGQGTSRENALGLAAATGHLVRSELDQLDQCDSPRLSRRAYFRRIAGKTAVLFGLSLTTGAHEAGAKPRVVAVLARAGYAMGMAFQVIDDVLDFTADEARLGKPVGTDLRIGLYTLPVIEAVRRDPSIAAALSGEFDLTALIARVRQAGGIAAARNVAAAYTARAQIAIDRLPVQPVRDGLSMLVRSLLSRDH